MNTTPTQSPTLAGRVAIHAEQQPGATALASRRLEVTWAELHERTRRVAARLLAIGVQRGDRVAVLSPNRPEVIEVQLACALVGAIFSPLNTRLSLPELRRITKIVEPRVVFHDEFNATVAEELDMCAQRISFDPGEALSYDQIVAAPTRFGGLDDIAPESPAMLIFTSGTSGKPLGAVLTHGQIEANHRQFLDTLPIDENTVNYAVAPLFHVAGLNTITGPTLFAGGTSVFAPRFDPDQAIDDIRDFGVNATFMVPTMWGDLVDAERFDDSVGARLEIGLVGGARCPERVELALRERGVALYEGYGMTEAGPMVTIRKPDDDSEPLSVGRPGPLVELRVVDEQGNPVDSDEVGELWVRAPNVMKGYWDDPAATRSALHDDGWLATGDTGHLSSGEFHLLDRVDDMINTGGENVYPSEVEAILEGHPDVREIAVVGTDDPRWGEAVTAVVVPSGDEMPDLASLRTYAEGRIARYKLPRRIESLASLPRSGAGKILRREVAGMISPAQSAAE